MVCAVRWGCRLMVISPRAYPHPVLASHFCDDVVDSEFDNPLQIKTTKTAYVLQAQCRTSNRGLLRLIEERKAAYAVHVECTSTRYRKVFQSTDAVFSFEIAADALAGKVQVCSFVLAAQPLPEYRNEDFHPDYGGLSFAVRKGDVLAVGEDQGFEAEKKSDPLRKPASIFTIAPNLSSSAKSIDMDASGNKVVVLLSQANFDHYQMLKHAAAYERVLHSAIVMPALVSLLEELRSAPDEKREEFKRLRWYGVLCRKLKERGIDLDRPESFNDSDSSLMLAHELLGEPLTSGLEKLASMTASEED